MKKIIFRVVILLVGFFQLSCQSNENDDDCTRTITYPQYYFVGSQIYYYDATLEVPCDFPDPEDPELIEPPLMENFAYDVLSFNFTPDTGNNTNRLEFEIKLNNLNDYPVSGFYYITLNIDGLVSSANYSNNGSNSCNEISANSSCIVSFDQESSLDLGLINSIELVEVQYYLTN